MSDKVDQLRIFYENSSFDKIKDIYADVIERASQIGIITSVRSLKLYKQKFGWKDKISAKQQKQIADKKNEGMKPIKIPKVKNENIVKEAVNLAKNTKPILKVDNEFNAIALQEKLTEVMTFLLQGASKARIFQHYKNKGENITRADVERLSQEAYNIYATIAPNQRETILGLNYERLNMLFDIIVLEMKKPNTKSTGFLAGKAVQILGEINSMFGIRSINLNVNNSDGIQNKINGMSDKEKMQRLIELNQKEDGSFGE